MVGRATIGLEASFYQLSDGLGAATEAARPSEVVDLLHEFSRHQDDGFCKHGIMYACTPYAVNAPSAPVVHGAQAAHLLRVAWGNTEDGQVKSRDEHLIRAKQRALICVDMGDFTHAVTGLRADLAGHL